MFLKKSIVLLSVLALPFVVSGCARVELASHIGKKIAGTTEGSKGYYKVGSPYKIKGKRYYPAVDYDYNKVGMASWYGPNFHGKMTANGETFDQNDLTAAHKTLPLPSIVRVTNLENGRSLIVRVNDRGPYAHERVIDMSKRSAELLGFKHKGIAKVRVQVLEDESRKLAQVAQNGGDTRGMEVPMNDPNYKGQRPDKIIKVAKAAQSQSSPAVASPPASVGEPQVLASVSADMASYAPAAGAQGAGQKVFVQMGSFSTRESAMKYASSLGKSYGRAQVHSATVNGAQFYRVKLPAVNPVEAQGLQQKLLSDGYRDALVVVDDLT